MKRIALITAVLLLAPAARSAERFEFSEVHMGVRARIVLYADGAEQAKDAARAGFDQIAHLDDVLSDYRLDNELARLNAAAGYGPIAVSQTMFHAVAVSLEMAERTGGAFDPTVGPIVKLWRESSESGELPSEEALAGALSRVGWQKVELDAETMTIELVVPGMALDFGGIGKGLAANEAFAVLFERGITTALVDVGGDLMFGEAPPGTDGWSVRVPRGEGYIELTLEWRAVVTSGDTHQFVEIDGVRYSHIVDPTTGLGTTHRARGSVVMPGGARADALASAAAVLGTEGAKDLLAGFPRTSLLLETVEQGISRKLETGLFGSDPTPESAGLIENVK